MKKRKILSKKIEELKARLAKDAKKLAKLTLKLGAAVTKGKSHRKTKDKREPVTGTKKRAAAPSKKKTASPRRTAPAKPSAAVSKPVPPPTTKKKLNLTPERRAQLAAAMKARWEAKERPRPQNPKETARNHNAERAIGDEACDEWPSRWQVQAPLTTFGLS